MTTNEPLIFVIAGEPSGDGIGGRLMAALRQQSGGRVRFAGVGGAAMSAEGLDSLFPMSELSVMGVVEILPRAPKLLRRMRETAAAIRDLRPAAVVSVDAPAFCFGVWRRLRGAGIPLIHYVAPTVWAWRHGLGEPGPVLGVLPGSRRGEVERLMPHFGAAVARLSDQFPDLEVVVPAVPALAPEIEAASRDWPVRAVVSSETEAKYDAMAACDAAIAASGTVSLELALARVPMVIGYRLNPVTMALAKRMVRVKYVNLINLLLDRPAVPELLQRECRADRLAVAAAGLLDNETARAEQLAAAGKALAMLSVAGATPSDRAAGIVLDLIAAAGDADETTTKVGT